MKPRATLETQTVRILALLLICGSLLLATVVVIHAIITEGGGNHEVVLALFATAIIGLVGGTMCLVPIASIERRQMPALMRSAIMCTLAAAFGWLLIIWFAREQYWVDNTTLLRLVGSATLIAAGLTIGGQLMIQQPRSTLLTLWCRCSAAIVWCFMAWNIHLVWSEWWYVHEEIVGMSTVILGMLIIMNLIATVLMLRGSGRIAPESIPARTALRLKCPKCQAEQALSSGLVKCAACRFAMVIQVQEPRCECGYLLYQLQGDTCPECGRAIRRTEEVIGESGRSACK